MPAPTINVTTTGTDPKTADVDQLESEVNAALEANYDSQAAHEGRTDNPHAVTKAQVGLGDVDNTPDANKPVSGPQQAALDTKADLIGGKVPTSQLPADVLGAVSYQGSWDADLNTPTIPSASSANKGHYYRVSVAGATPIDGISDWGVGDWIVSNGAVWEKIDNSETVTSVAGKAGAVTLVKTDVGLGNVDDTPDTEKPVSGPQQEALDAHEGRTDNPHAVTKAQVGLGDVDNTPDANKPVSGPQQAALDTKADLIGGDGTIAKIGSLPLSSVSITPDGAIVNAAMSDGSQLHYHYGEIPVPDGIVVAPFYPTLANNGKIVKAVMGGRECHIYPGENIDTDAVVAIFVTGQSNPAASNSSLSSGGYTRPLGAPFSMFEQGTQGFGNTSFASLATDFLTPMKSLPSNNQSSAEGIVLQIARSFQLRGEPVPKIILTNVALGGARVSQINTSSNVPFSNMVDAANKIAALHPGKKMLCGVLVDIGESDADAGTDLATFTSGINTLWSNIDTLVMTGELGVSEWFMGVSLMPVMPFDRSTLGDPIDYITKWVEFADATSNVEIINARYDATYNDALHIDEEGQLNMGARFGQSFADWHHTGENLSRCAKPVSATISGSDVIVTFDRPIVEMTDLNYDEPDLGLTYLRSDVQQGLTGTVILSDGTLRLTPAAQPLVSDVVAYAATRYRSGDGPGDRGHIGTHGVFAPTAFDADNHIQWPVVPFKIAVT